VDEDTAEQTRRLVHRFYEHVWNAWDDDAVDTVLAHDFSFRGSFGMETEGRDGWRTYRDMIRAGSEDFHNELMDLVCEPGRAAARLRCSGHHTGALLGIKATGKEFAYDAAAFFQCSGGLLTKAWVLGDLEGLRAQLTAS
jgi:predicted ester cyclase